MAHTGAVTLELGGAGATPGAESSIGRRRRPPAGAGARRRLAAHRPADADALVSCLVSPGFDFADFELEP